MKNVLIATTNTPGYAPNELASYILKSRSDINPRIATVPAKHEQRFIPGWSHFRNGRSVIEQAKSAGLHFDVAIAPDPAFALAMFHLRKLGLVDRVIYWRLDYYPKWRTQLLDFVYQEFESKALKNADTVWSIADPNISYVRDSITKHTPITKVEYVPYLLHEDQVNSISITDSVLRSDIAMWMGPDLDGSRPLCTEAAQKLNVTFMIADYSIDKYRIPQDELDELLRMAKVGVAPYRPEPFSSKYYCDASRIRRFLTYGVPVVTTSVAPTHLSIVQEDCGFISDYTVDSLAEGIKYCKDNFSRLSTNAYRAAKKYTFERWFAENSNLL